MKLCLFLLPWFPFLVSGHGAVVHPPPRNRVITIMMLMMMLTMVMLTMVMVMMMMVMVVMLFINRWTASYRLGLDPCLVLFPGLMLGLFMI